MPNEYLYYFYYRERAVANVLSSPQTRGELIEEINREMTSELASIDIENDFEKGLACFEKWYGMRENNYMAAETGIHRDKPWTFDVYGKDAGGYAGVALRFMDIARSGKTQQMILCTPTMAPSPAFSIQMSSSQRAISPPMAVYRIASKPILCPRETSN